MKQIRSPNCSPNLTRPRCNRPPPEGWANAGPCPVVGLPPRSIAGYVLELGVWMRRARGTVVVGPFRLNPTPSAPPAPLSRTKAQKRDLLRKVRPSLVQTGCMTTKCPVQRAGVSETPGLPTMVDLLPSDSGAASTARNEKQNKQRNRATVQPGPF
jgi:hypothetical protein